MSLVKLLLLLGKTNDVGNSDWPSNDLITFRGSLLPSATRGAGVKRRSRAQRFPNKQAVAFTSTYMYVLASKVKDE